MGIILFSGVVKVNGVENNSYFMKILHLFPLVLVPNSVA